MARSIGRSNAMRPNVRVNDKPNPAHTDPNSISMATVTMRVNPVSRLIVSGGDSGSVGQGWFEGAVLREISESKVLTLLNTSGM